MMIIRLLQNANCHSQVIVNTFCNGVNNMEKTKPDLSQLFASIYGQI